MSEEPLRVGDRVKSSKRGLETRIFRKLYHGTVLELDHRHVTKVHVQVDSGRRSGWYLAYLWERE